ncbi:RagB/SusD family nutrient uptake outer membrane protein [Maribellus comscasis]|uniref:RagB/SusD family nutrient uptake outer membrane protein n=1 Tax=Maribellus comscasis TaxID=2681766 RepID=A0A6I6JXJ3_9BACT|nr:RagB/SusD family nutrient uptake outer membrane protein [Maribellus comscasis]QGY42424.1 RagB/SusD family nutrient uptake outer membrane protein [Maribellus comscasis]
MKSKIKYSIIFILLTFLFVSCEDYLEKYPLNNPSDATFLSNQTELEMAVTGCYNAMWTSVQGMPFHLVFDQISDIGWDRNGSALQAIGRGSADSRNSDIVSLWTNLYKGIAKCNYVLANMERGVDNIPTDVYAQSKAEVRFLRAFYYHYLAELFGGVPLVTQPLTLSEANITRSSKADVVDFILTELDECANDLPQENDPLAGRATKGAAWAIMSRVALYNEKWDTAISSAQKVMALEGTEYELSSNYMDLFQYAGQESKEIILSVQFLKGEHMHSMFRFFGTRNAKGHTNKKPSYQAADSWECTDGLQIDESPLFDPQHPYENRDPRLGYTFSLSGSIFLGFQYETHGDSLYCWDYNQNPPKRIANLEATHAYATFTGIGWRKYADNLDKDAVNDSELNTIVIRYAEVLLNYAEAKISSGSIDQSVLDAINKIRQRPSVEMPPLTTTNAEELKYAVRRERKYELSCEGLRLFDIKRWGIAENVMNLPVLGRMKKSYPSIAPIVDEYGTSYYDNIPIAQQGESADFKMRIVEIRSFDKNRDYLWPIPYIEMDTNPEMVQNPGYGE